MQQLIVGIPKEVMAGEGRVAVLPDSLQDIAQRSGREISWLVEWGVGRASGFCNEDWERHGAKAASKDELFARAALIIKVKQPLSGEGDFLHSGQGVACFHHVNMNKAVVEKLIKMGVSILPFEYYSPAIHAMSKMAGERIGLVLEKFYGPGWRREKIFFGGARGTMCQTAIHHLWDTVGDPANQFLAFDLTAGWFVSMFGRRYFTLSTIYESSLASAMAECKIFVLAAITKHGAPKFLKPRHLDLMPDGSFIIQVSIDEGGNIDDPHFCQTTYWGSSAVYRVRRVTKEIQVCNLPNLPGCINPSQSSFALDRALGPYFVELLRAWPHISDRYIFKGFHSVP